MIFNDSIKEEINDIYYNLREKAEYYPNIINSLLNKSKEYTKISNDLSKLKLAKSNAIYLEKTELIADIDNKINITENKRIEYLKKYNLSNGNLYPKYSCSICNDTGSVNGKYCKCYYKYYNQVVSNRLGLNEINELNDFENIKELENHYKFFNQYIEKFPNVSIPSYIFTGKTGTGKTYLSKYIVNNLQNNGFTTLFITSIKLNNLFLKVHTNQDEKESILNILTNTDLLVIDDLGTEPIYKNVTIEYLNYIISSRLNDNKAFIISTNLTNNEILEKYNDRIFSRLMDKNKVKNILFNLNDLRINKV